MQQSRGQYLADLESRLADCGARIETLDARASELGIKGQIEYEAHVMRARRRWDELSEKPAELRACGPEQWANLSAAVGRARLELVEVVEQAERFLSTSAAIANRGDAGGHGG